MIVRVRSYVVLLCVPLFVREMVRQILVSGYSSGFFTLTFDEDSGHVRPLAASEMVEGSENDAFMSYTVFDDRTKNLYAVHEFEGEVGKDFDGEATVSRWKLSEKMTTIEKKQVRKSDKRSIFLQN